MKKKLITLKLPPKLHKIAQDDCYNKEITFTSLIENYLREKYKDCYKKLTVHEDCSKLDIEDYPLNPKIIKVEEIVNGL